MFRWVVFKVFSLDLLCIIYRQILRSGFHQKINSPVPCMETHYLNLYILYIEFFGDALPSGSPSSSHAAGRKRPRTRIECIARDFPLDDSVLLQEGTHSEGLLLNGFVEYSTSVVCVYYFRTIDVIKNVKKNRCNPYFIKLHFHKVNMKFVRILCFTKLDKFILFYDIYLQLSV